MRGRVRCPEVDLERLRTLWADPDLTRAEIARDLGLTYGQLHGAVTRAGLPRRPSVHRSGSIEDLTVEEIWRRAAEVKARSIDGMRRETDKATERRLEREQERERALRRRRESFKSTMTERAMQ